MIFFERTYEQNESSFLFIPITKKVSDSIINFRIGNGKKIASGYLFRQINS